MLKISMHKDDIVIHGRPKDLGGFIVARTLPTARCRSIGPFVFLDHMGPVTVDEENGLDVRPHPHIGLSTVTYLFSGRGLHRDSLGTIQIIEPGELNVMTAGRGIVHSERTPVDERRSYPKKQIHGVQIWAALPKEKEDIDPSFVHYAKEKLPAVELFKCLKGRLLIGEYMGIQSPVKMFSRTLFMDLLSEDALRTELSFAEKELGFLFIQGGGRINQSQANAEDLVIISDPKKVSIELEKDTRLILIGGNPHPEPRYMWWNFVSSKKESIREAADLWRQQKMGIVPEENDYVPIPNDPLP
ncbi:MAG: pirin family protein [Oligoflexia bacterium]|nr:pirin family protein [Oligoflexia bacterium]